VASTVSWDSTNSYYYPTITPVSEGSTTLTFTDVATGKVSATAVVKVVAAVAKTVTTATDAASYAPGTKVVYTITATDAAGNPVADGTYGSNTATATVAASTSFLSTAPTSNFGLQGTLVPANGNLTFASGIASSTLYAPLSGPVSISGGVLNASAAYLATALQGTTLPAATFEVTGDSSVNDNIAIATDAANAATDAANAAAESADNATQAATDALDAVQELQAQVTKLFAALKAQIAALAKSIAKGSSKK
jgi:hypothetical protein